MSPELRQVVITTCQNELRAEAAARRIARRDSMAEPVAPHPTRLGGLLRRLAGMPTFA